MSDTILIVDDEYANRFLLEQVLSEYNTITVSSADEMWKYLSGKTADLILLDVMMPDQDGFETAKALSANPEYADIPVVFVTARSDAEDLSKGFELGGYDYVKKPFDEIELLARVKSTLKKRKDQKALNDFAFRDVVTGFYNRRYFDDLVRRESDRINRGLLKMAIAMCDIDFFKRINDTYGHLCGDYILKTFAQTIMNGLRAYDIAIRYGGEEFVILFPHLNKEAAGNVLKRTREIHDRTDYLFENRIIRFTFSAGIADSSEFIDGPLILGDMLQRADSRLYIAKNSGRNRVVLFNE
jgi:two-component system, cell cycle response regulator